MGIVDSIKADAEKNRTKIQSSEAAELEKILDKLFYLDRKIEEETKFVKQVMTRGLESAERTGLHASAMIVSDDKFCVRQQVLSLLYKQLQGEQLPVSLLKIFEEGNAIHEKWQRLLIRGGYANFNTLDRTRYDEEYMLSYSPDIVCRIPEFYNGLMVGEIKSVNTFQFKKMSAHPSAKKQLQLYMYLCQKAMNTLDDKLNPDYKKGFVLCEDKNTQEIKLEVYDFEWEKVHPFVVRLEEVKMRYQRVLSDNKMARRHENCTSAGCKMAENCPMRDACWNVGMGRMKL